MGRHNENHKPIKQILFRLGPNNVIIYDLKKDGSHKENMKRAIRTNYKKKLKEKEESQALNHPVSSDYNNAVTLPTFELSNNIEKDDDYGFMSIGLSNLGEINKNSLNEKEISLLDDDDDESTNFNDPLNFDVTDSFNDILFN